MDQGTFVTFGDNPYAPQYSSSRRYYHYSSTTNTTTTTTSSSSSSSGTRRQLPWHAIKLGNQHLDFRGFGDVAGRLCNYLVHLYCNAAYITSN